MDNGAARGVIDADAVYELVRARAEATPDLPMIFDEHGRTLTFGEYHKAVLAMAAALHGAGIRPNSRVAWQLTTSVEALVLTGALARLGVVQVLLLPVYRRRELLHIVGQSQPEMLIVSRKPGGFDYVGLAGEVGAEFPELRIVAVEDLAGFPPESLPPYLAPGPDEARFIIYTSGTTGVPKGVQHSDQSVIAGTRAQYLALEIGPDDRQTLNFPFAHIGGMMNLVTMAATGASSVIVERFTPRDHVPLFRELGVTLPGTGPVFVRMYLEVQREQPGRSILPEARGFPGGGAPKTPTLHAEVKAEIGSDGLLTGYGMSECALIATVHAESPDEKKALMDGLPAMGASIRLVDESGGEVAAGDEGEIRVKGPQVFIGYVDPDLDREAFDDDGYFLTGDLGRFDVDGYLRLTGRAKDLIIRKGENISPKEIEDLLSPHPGVGEVAVVGLPDEERGEIACAVVVPAAAAEPIRLGGLTEYLESAGVAKQKLPERLELVEALPKNVMGKVQKEALRRRFSPDPQMQVNQGG